MTNTWRKDCNGLSGAEPFRVVMVKIQSAVDLLRISYMTSSRAETVNDESKDFLIDIPTDDVVQVQHSTSRRESADL